MLYVILSSIILLALLDRSLRGGRLRLIEIEFEFRLFALRDKVRNAAIAEEIQFNNWFDYMDTTLTRTIDRIGYVNPWMAVGYCLVHKDDPTIASSHRALDAALRLPENRRLAEIYREYINHLNWFLSSRYRVTFPIAAITLAILSRSKGEKGIHASADDAKKELAPIFSVAPETSTLSEYGLNGNRQRVFDIHTSEPHLMAR